MNFFYLVFSNCLVSYSQYLGMCLMYLCYLSLTTPTQCYPVFITKQFELNVYKQQLPGLHQEPPKMKDAIQYLNSQRHILGTENLPKTLPWFVLILISLQRWQHRARNETKQFVSPHLIGPQLHQHDLTSK